MDKDILEMLREAQKMSGDNFVSLTEAEKIAKENHIPLSRVYGTGTFYTMLSFKPRGKHIIRVCRSLSCHLANGDNVANKIKKILGIDFGETTEDGEFTLEGSSCLGLCSVAPAIMIDNIPYGKLTLDKVKDIIDKVKEGDNDVSK